MKFKLFSFILAALLISAPFAFGQGHFSVSSVDGEVSPGVLATGQAITFTIHVENDGSANGGITNGFRIHSPNGAEWGSLSGDTIFPGWTAMFPLISTIIPANTDGVGADTLGFGSSRLISGGLPANFSEDVYTLTIGPIDAIHGGKTIVVDSSFYPNTGNWKWASPDEFPTWGGPYTYIVEGGDPPNEAPVLAAIGNQSIFEDQLLTINVSATDADGDPITLGASPMPTGANFVDNGDGTGVFTWTPTFEQANLYNVTFTASDGTDDATEAIEINVINSNRAPVLAAIGNQSTDENQELVINFSATDADGDGLIMGATPLPTGADYVDNGDGTATFTWTPDFDQAGLYNVSFTAHDGSVAVVEEIEITVINVNRAPELAAIGNQMVDEGQLLTINLSATDPDGDDLLYIIVSPIPIPDGADFNPTTGVFTWTPGFDQAGDYQFNFAVSDLTDQDNEIITISVNNVNQPPVLAEIGPRFVTAGETITFDVSASDVDGTTPSFTTSTLPGTSTFVDNGDGTGTFSWTTLVTDNGSFPITFTASDGEFTDDELINITIGEAPKILVVSSDSIDFNYFDEISTMDSLPITITEQNSFVIVAEAMNHASWLTFSGPPNETPVAMMVFADPAGLAVGTYVDTIHITSSEAANSVDLIVSMIINERPNTDPYIITPEALTFATDECSVFDQHFVVGDDEQDPVAISIVGLVENMTFVDNGDNTADLHFAPNFSQAGTYPIDVILFDGRDSASYSGSIIVEECEPGTEGDTVTVATVPAVPGAQVVVPVDFANLCALSMYDISLGFDNANLTLDSISYADSRVVLIDNFDMIDNAAGNVTLSRDWSEADMQTPGTGNMVNLHFSLAVETPAGFYALNYFNEPSYERDCGGGAEVIRPFFIPGGIVVDTSGNYVCGYVVDPDGLPIPGAMVQLWNDYPGGSVEMETQASGTGVFAFSEFTTIPFDLYAYHEGFYPGKVENINFAQSGIMIVLTPTEPMTPTNTWVDFFCGASTFKNVPLPAGSIVETYDPDGVKCGEFMVTTPGEYGFLHCYGDDEFETGDQGAVSGDLIRFYVNGIEATTYTDAIWTQDRDVVELCFEVPDVSPHSCMLFEGWNLISWNVDTDIDDINTVLASIESSLETVMGFEQGALTYDKDLPQFSDLWSVDHLSGYWVKVSQDVELTVMGTPVPATTPIPVTAGWNLVSYLPNTPNETELALASISENLIVSLGYDDNNGLTYVPGQNEFNDLLTMTSCYGYWVKVSANDILTYPGDDQPTAIARNTVSNTAASSRIRATNAWVNLYAYQLTLNNREIKAGAEINAYNHNGLQVGSYQMKDDGLFGFMPIYGDDMKTDDIDGVKAGETFYLTVDGAETEESFTWTTSGDKIEISGLTSKTTSENGLPTSYSLSQNYPNPFNPTTTISFDMPVNGLVKLEIFNMLGQLVATPFNGLAEAGTNEISWDATDLNGQKVSSGIYLYRLSADNFTETKKMTLLK